MLNRRYELALHRLRSQQYDQWLLVMVQGSNIQESEWNFLQLLTVTMLKQYVHEPTRGKHILDIFSTNNPFLVNSVQVRNTELSDHKLMQVSLSFDDWRDSSSYLTGIASLHWILPRYTMTRKYDRNITRLNFTFEEFPEVMTKIFLGFVRKRET